VPLESYACASDPKELQQQVIQALMSGVSTRQMSAVKPKSPGISRSSVSRLWQEAGSRLVEELRSRDLSRVTWCALLADGIRLSDDQVAVAAIGIDNEGNKHVLDFSLGSSENLETARELLTRITRRGFRCEHRLFVLLDGSDALRSAIKEHFPESVVQRCLVHKERNIKGKLPKSRWGELSRLFRRLRKVQGYEAACEVVRELKAFLKPLNAEAYHSLEEAGEDLLALHRLNAPNTLHRSLLSTNAIENSYLNTRRRIGRVTRFRAETDQASRWLAYALLEAEKGFRKIHGHKDLHHLISALEGEPDSAPESTSAGPLPSPTAPAPATAKPPIGST
jgi:putative transposase